METSRPGDNNTRPLLAESGGDASFLAGDREGYHGRGAWHPRVVSGRVGWRLDARGG